MTLERSGRLETRREAPTRRDEGAVEQQGVEVQIQVGSPRQRTTSQFTGGAAGACDGVLALDFHAWRVANPGALGSPFSAGDVVWAQIWYRDPSSPTTSNFTSAVRFMTCP